MSCAMSFRTRSGGRNSQQGLSLVELMVGITVGLFIVAAATTLMASQLVDNRKLLLETQMQQDLRASMDIITRQLRRAGAQDIGQAQTGVAMAGSGGAKNDYAPVTPDSSPSAEVDFAFYRNADDKGPYGFKLDGGVIKTLSGTAWQDLTDSETLNVTAFTITPSNVSTSVLPCPNLCPGNTTDCWPTLVVRELTVSITAQAKSDANVRRTLSTQVRVRNDWVRFADTTKPICP